MEHLQNLDFFSHVVKVILNIKGFSTGQSQNSTLSIVCKFYAVAFLLLTVYIKLQAIFFIWPHKKEK